MRIGIDLRSAGTLRARDRFHPGPADRSDPVGAEHLVVRIDAPWVAAREPLPQLPATWQELKAKRAGEVGYHLFARNAGGAVPE